MPPDTPATHLGHSDSGLPVAPKGIRQHDFNLGWRACEADTENMGAALERATALAERYGEAIVAISAALPNVNKVRLILAALGSEDA